MLIVSHIKSVSIKRIVFTNGPLIINTGIREVRVFLRTNERLTKGLEEEEQIYFVWYDVVIT